MVRVKKLFLFLELVVVLFCISLTANAANVYLVDYSDQKYLSEQDVQDFTVQELCYAKNEIFARHGRLFLSPELMDYFNAQEWYNGYILPEDFQDSTLSELEMTNAEFLRSLEFSRQENGYQLDQPGYDIWAVRTMRESNSEAVLTEEQAEYAVSNYLIERDIESYFTFGNADEANTFVYWVTYRTTGIKAKYVVNAINGQTYEYAPYFGVEDPLTDTLTETYLFNAFDYLGDAESYKTSLVSEEKIQSMKAGNIEKLGTWFYLDFDGDGQSESVSFLVNGPYAGGGREYCVSCQIFVEDDMLEQSGDNIECGIYGVSLDGEHIWLVIADDGPSDDPICTFYSYEQGELKQIGAVKDWIDHISVTTDGLIMGGTSCRVFDTALIEACWQLDDSGMVLMIPQEYYRMYHYIDDYDVTLTEPITVYEDRNEQSAATIMQPQKIEIPYTDAVQWVYLVGEDGTAGWLRTGNMSSTDRMRVFEGLFMAD